RDEVGVGDVGIDSVDAGEATGDRTGIAGHSDGAAKDAATVCRGSGNGAGVVHFQGAEAVYSVCRARDGAGIGIGDFGYVVVAAGVEKADTVAEKARDQACIGYFGLVSNGYAVVRSGDEAGALVVTSAFCRARPDPPEMVPELV